MDLFGFNYGFILTVLILVTVIEYSMQGKSCYKVNSKHKEG